MDFGLYTAPHRGSLFLCIYWRGLGCQWKQRYHA